MKIKTACAYALSLCAVGCDARTESDYPGESLMHLEGRVIVTNPDAPDDLVPVIAYETERGYRLVDVKAKGDFPNNFSIDVYTPPPADAILRRGSVWLEPASGVAVGYVAAARRDHPQFIENVSYSDFATENVSSLPGCADAQPACVVVRERCIYRADGEECVKAGYPCTDYDACEPVAAEGDVGLFDKPLGPGDYFAGASETHMVVWAERNIPKNTLFSIYYGIDEKLKSGYSLIELGEYIGDSGSIEPVTTHADGDGVWEDGEPTVVDAGGNPVTVVPPSVVVAPVCEDDQYQAEAFAIYNQRNGTSWSSFRQIYDAETYEGELHYVEEDVYDLITRLAVDQGCNITEYEGTKVIRNGKTKLRIVLGEPRGLPF